MQRCYALVGDTFDVLIDGAAAWYDLFIWSLICSDCGSVMFCLMYASVV